MKVVTYTIEVSLILDLEDPELDELENLQPEITDEEVLREYIADEARIGNFEFVRDANRKLIKRYETVTM